MFQLGAGGETKEVARVNGLTMANRVVLVRPIHGQETTGSDVTHTEARVNVLIPLESFPGGLALVEVARANEGAEVAATVLSRRTFTDDADTCYCACTSHDGEYVYAFAAHASEMHVFRSSKATTVETAACFGEGGAQTPRDLRSELSRV